jgi:hypothetical protein
MTTFVLVHGAFASSAELAPAIPALEALGHREAPPHVATQRTGYAGRLSPGSLRIPGTLR